MISFNQIHIKGIDGSGKGVFYGRYPGRNPCDYCEKILKEWED